MYHNGAIEFLRAYFWCAVSLGAEDYPVAGQQNQYVSEWHA